jgi:hypothetical protein
MQSRFLPENDCQLKICSPYYILFFSGKKGAVSCFFRKFFPILTISLQ